eukprot:symbB.v1.2.025425.t1/scaffold2465.1/size78641/1
MNDVKRTQDPEDLGKSMEFMDLKLDCLMVELSKYGKAAAKRLESDVKDLRVERVADAVLAFAELTVQLEATSSLLHHWAGRPASLSPKALLLRLETLAQMGIRVPEVARGAWQDAVRVQLPKLLPTAPAAGSKEMPKRSMAHGKQRSKRKEGNPMKRKTSKSASKKDKIEAHFRTLRRRSGVPARELPSFFLPIIPSNSEAKQRWTFRARNLQPLSVKRTTWTPAEVQRLQRVMHAELLESSFQEEFQQKAATLDLKGQQQIFAELASKLDGKRLRELLPERIECVDWLNVSNKLRAMTLGDEDSPCMSASNCLIQYLHHVVHKSYRPITPSEEASMKQARDQFGGSLYLNQIADCTGLVISAAWRCFASHLQAEMSQAMNWSAEDCEKLQKVCDECGTSDWQLVASRLGDVSPEDCEAQWRKLSAHRDGCFQTRIPQHCRIEKSA